jgi:hypothetical protein
MLSRRRRYLLGGALFVIGWSAFYAGGFVDEPFDGLIAFAVAATVLAGLLVVTNVGFQPRIKDGFLVVSTICGRQAIDLSDLTRVKVFWPNLNHRRATVRLADPANLLTTQLSLDEYRDELAGPFGDAAERGVVVPRSARSEFGLSADERSPRWGYRAYVLEALVIIALWAIGPLAVVILWAVL